MISWLRGTIKKRFFLIVLLAELILLIYCMAGLSGKDAVYEYGLEDMTVRFGGYSENLGGIYTDDDEGQAGNVVDFEEITLPKGTYRVCLQYQTDTDMENICTVSDVSLGERFLLSNGEHLYQGLDQTDFEMWVLKDTSQLVVHTTYNGQGSVLVKRLTIYETNAMGRIRLFLAALLSITVDVCIVLWKYGGRKRFSCEQKIVFWGLAATIVVSAIPVLPDSLIWTGDLVFHLWRIEGIKAGLLTGQFPVRISAEWLWGYGYAAPVFYGETFLLFPALLRMIGFTVSASYRYYLIAVSGATVLIAYYCFKKILGSRYMGLFASMLYNVSVYRVHKLYVRGTLGEALAMMLLPLLVYGFYKVFTQDIHEKEYRWNWIPLTLGYAGIVQSHLLTGEMAGGFTILLCIIMWKKVFRWPTFMVLAKTVLYALLLSAWFLVPFADYMLTGDFQVQHIFGRRIQERGIYIGHLLRTFFASGNNLYFGKTGMYGTDAVGIGPALTAAFGIWIFLAFFGYTGRMKRTDRGLGTILAVFSGISMLLSLAAFPWDRIQFLNPITETLVSSLQFPDRILTIANLCLPLLAGVVGKYILEKKEYGLKCGYFGMMMVLVISGSVYLMYSRMDNAPVVKLYNEAGMGFGYVSSGEYLPYGTDTSQITFTEPRGEGIEVETWGREGLKLDIICRNPGTEGRELEVPLLYYKGYQACAVDTGESLEVYAGRNSTVTILLPAGFDGEISVRFKPFWYWRLGEGITYLSAAALIMARLKWKKENCETDSLKSVLLRRKADE